MEQEPSQQSTDDRLTRVEAQSFRIGSDLADINGKLDRLTERVEQKFEQIDSRLDKLAAHAERTDARLDRLTAAVEAVHGDVQANTARLDRHGVEIAKILRRLELEPEDT